MNASAPPLAVIVSTYNQPRHLERCLYALSLQREVDFEVLVADDGSADETRQVIESQGAHFDGRLRHLWQEDRGFRKTRILNRAIDASRAEYLVFMDGDCVAHPDFLAEHRRCAEYGRFLNGAMIRLSEEQTAQVTAANIASGEVFTSPWLTHTGGRWNRRYLKLSLGFRVRDWLNRHSTTELYWLGANSSCFRADAVAVNGFDNSFTYGFEDGDFGNRLINYGLTPATVRWTANVLHLDHGRPYRDQAQWEENRRRQTAVEPGGPFRCENGLDELEPEPGDEPGQLSRPGPRS